ncbi:MAG: amidohydrolase [Bacteroidales bacterium]|nr:amidohydrolase [Bacteroidales bacterium]
MDDKLKEELKAFRRELHQYPEVSHREEQTANRVISWLDKCHPDRIVEGLGGNGLAAVWDGRETGPAILFRCELDALPVREISTLAYRSVYEGKGHLCGHDGHMAIMAGFAYHLRKNRPGKGRVILLFQPAEETGEGAEMVLNDTKFQSLKPDRVFALHNLPGFRSKSLVLADRLFSSASAGLEIRLTGKSSHAAEPEKGINPALAVARIINSFNDMLKIKDFFHDFILITVIQVILGEKAFGTSPGDALIRATLRAYTDTDMDKLQQMAIGIAEKAAAEERLQFDYRFTEVFPATVNQRDTVKILEQIAGDNGWDTIRISKPFRWSEDFGHFTSRFKGAMIGLGAGMSHPALHNPDYDFPDDLLEKGIELFISIYKRFMTS